MPAAAHLERGRHAEQLAARYLADRGLELVAANFQCRVGELDLVMADGPVLAVVEVRCRLDGALVDPIDSITPAKIRRILRATAVFLAHRSRFADWPVRFDVVAITGPDQARTVRWLKNAFTGDDVRGA